MKKVFSLFLSFLILCFSGFFHQAHAAGEFTTTFNSVYVVSESGETSVTHTITLQNNLAHIYATDYTLATSGDHLTHVSAVDETGPLTLVTSVAGGTTTLHLTIDHPSIGQGKAKTITVNYQTTDVVEVLGNTTTINIPRLARANEAESYTRIVKVAGLTDKPVVINPLPNSTEQVDPYTVYTFVGHGSDSLTLLFGDSVTYKLNLTYELKNKELGSVDSELALPPDTDYQHIILASLNPAPLTIRLDADGNWLARYSLRSQEKLRVEAELYVTVYPEPKLDDPSSHALIKSPHSKYWQTSDTLVADLSTKLKTPENIYTYLVGNFTYNYAGLGATQRLGASAALASPNLVLCTEFTDTFVAIARANNIPAREINGYGFTTNPTLRPQSSETDVLHAWPEFYDATSGKWVAVDPTWGNTTGGVNYFNKLDFSHIVFVRHGVEDSYPLPAGAYKDTPNQKFVHVEISVNPPKENGSYEIKNNQVYNTGNVALINEQIKTDKGVVTVPYVPPYGSLALDIKKELSLYDKIKALCANLLSKLQQLLPAST